MTCDVEELSRTPVEQTGIAHRCEYLLRVPASLEYFDGHFDGKPLLPAVVQLAVVILPRVEWVWPDLGGLRSARKIKFRSPIAPDDSVRLELIRRGQDVAFVLDRPGEVCASGTLRFDEKRA